MKMKTSKKPSVNASVKYRIALSVVAIVVMLSSWAVNVVYADITLSAPIFPTNLNIVQNYQNENYPADKQAQIDLVGSYFMKYESLLDECAKIYSKDNPLPKKKHSLHVKTSIGKFHTEGERTQVQILQNYLNVAQCSYREFHSKPYFIPQLVDDVDICGTILGPEYRMITEDDVNGFSAAFYKELDTVITRASSGVEGVPWGEYYFSLATYIRGNDGALKVGNLYNGVTSDRVEGLPQKGEKSKSFLLGHRVNTGDSYRDVKVVLRCILDQ